MSITILGDAHLVVIINEKFKDDYSDFPWGADWLGWHCVNEDYYKAVSSLNLIESSVILLAAIFARKIPRYVFYSVVLLIMAWKLVFGSYYSKESLPTWILDIF